MKKIMVLVSVIALSAGCKKKSEPAAAAKDAAAPPAVDAAPEVPVDAPEPPPAPDAAAAGQQGAALPDDWFTTGCPKVLARIGQCAGDKAFVAALTADIDKSEQKETVRRAADTKRYAKEDKAKGICGELQSVTFEDQGFLDGNWSNLAADDVLADCAKLGAAIKDAGGLFGGSVDE